MKYKFQTQYDLEKREQERNNGLTKTVPDHALTIKQIMERHTVGQNIEQKEGRYHDESGDNEELIGVETGGIMEKLDHQEIHEKAIELKQRQEQREQDQQKERIEKFKKDSKKRDDKIKAEAIEEYKKSQSQNTKTEGD